MKLSTIDLMLKLIAHKPVTADLPRVNAATADLRAYLESNGVHTATETLDGREILYAATKKTKTPRVLLNAHIDVVPAEDAVFNIREEAGWLVGRGTHDDLGNLALIANLLVAHNGKADIGAVFSSDEETGGATTKAMVDRGYGAKELVLVLDGEGYAVAVGQKGIIKAHLTAAGTACHAAYPWRGDNAIDRLVDGYAKLRALFPPVAPPYEWRDTMAATIVNAGTVINRVPETAAMSLNIRFTRPGDDARILKLLAETSGLEVQGSVDCQPLVFSPDTPALKKLTGFMQEKLAREIRIVYMNGATDARHFAALNVPVAIIGAPGLEAHGTHERLEIAGLHAYEKMLAAFLV